MARSFGAVVRVNQRHTTELLRCLHRNTIATMLELYKQGEMGALLPDRIRKAIAWCRQMGCSYKDVDRAVNTGWQEARRRHFGQIKTCGHYGH